MAQPGTQSESALHDASVGQLISRLGEDTATLVRQEMQLARAELSEKVDVLRSEMTATVTHAREDVSAVADRVLVDLKESGRRAGIGLGMLGGGAAVAVLASGALTALLILALDAAMPAWAAALIVTGVYAALAAILLMIGRERLQSSLPLVSPGTRQALKTDAAELVSETKHRAAGSIPELKPEETLETLKEDVEWAKHPTRSA